MALPTDIRTLFAELPQARADRTARAEEQRLAQDALRAELQVAWDWLLGDGQELAAELRTANFNRLELLGPLDEEGREGPWQIGCRALVLLDDGQIGRAHV